MKLKLHTNLSLTQHGFPVEILIPFIGTFNKEDEPGFILHGRFDNFLSHGKDFIELTDIERSDVCLFPIVYERSAVLHDEVLDYIKSVERFNKKMLVFAGHDTPVNTVPIENAIIFNSAVSKSTRPYNVFSWPHFFEDFLSKYYNDEVQPRPKSATPVVGFCGYAPPLDLEIGRDKLVGSLKLVANYLGLIQRFPDKASHSYRARSIIGLKRSKRIILNLKLKRKFAFGPEGRLNSGITEESNTEFRRAFVENIFNSDYTLCVRGIGNNSVRFYETLCCGRIPIFVNTDSVLPFDHLINWRELCVWVDEKDIDNIGEVVANYHKRISAQEFMELQVRLRNIWKQFFSPEGFFNNMDAFIDKTHALNKTEFTLL
jgi:uncharacterized protein YggL (DUF469 family)